MTRGYGPGSRFNYQTTEPVLEERGSRARREPCPECGQRSRHGQRCTRRTPEDHVGRHRTEDAR